MKPKNKFQQSVLDTSKKLPKITDAQVEWAYRNCIEHIGRRSAKGIITCTECGHSWQGNGELVDTLTECRCPQCDTKLKVENTRKSVFYDYEYLCIVTAYEGFQVLRFLYVECRAKAGGKPHYSHMEAVQRWIAPNGKYATLARLRPMGYFSHGWSYGSGLEIRPEKSMYNITPTCIYPRQRVIPELKRTGYKETFGKLTPFDMIHALLAEPKAETLLKTGQKELLQYFIYNSRNVNDYWPSIRIAIRNGYRIKDAHSWVDYIDLLRYFGKDLHNAKYVCPADLKAEHDRYVDKKRTLLERQQIEKKRKQAIEQENKFKEMKAKFFGIGFTDGHIDVRVLESVEEIMIEGEKMHHCIFTNNYHLKPDSLILSACIGGERIETIEFSLSRLAILQSRGVCNSETAYHGQIIDLVNRNIPVIQKRMAS